MGTQGNAVAVPSLYTSYSGHPINKFSYSMAKDIATCGFYVDLSRIQGWTQKFDNATMKLGQAVEKALQDYYLLGWESAQQSFEEAWEFWREKPLLYKEKDNWGVLAVDGRKVIAEFVRVAPKLPIGDPKFSVVVPEDMAAVWYNGTRLEGIIDCITDYSKKKNSFVVDIKCSGQRFPEQKGIAALDPQLQIYSLLTGIRKVALLNLVRYKREPLVQWIPGVVTDEHLEGVQAWLEEQYHKYLDRKLHRSTGIRFPHNHCTMCSMLPKCLGDDEGVAETLRRRDKEDTEKALEAMDAL
jgi:hypothetical protein